MRTKEDLLYMIAEVRPSLLTTELKAYVRDHERSAADDIVLGIQRVDWLLILLHAARAVVPLRKFAEDCGVRAIQTYLPTLLERIGMDKQATTLRELEHVMMVRDDLDTLRALLACRDDTHAQYEQLRTAHCAFASEGVRRAIQVYLKATEPTLTYFSIHTIAAETAMLCRAITMKAEEDEISEERRTQLTYLLKEWQRFSRLRDLQ